MHRRQFLTVIGGGAVLAAGGLGTFAATRTPTKALAPWSAAGAYADPRLNALSYAILAPNPHNRQPWKVALEGENALTLYFDTDRQLPHTDPFDRQLTIGLGCFLELMSLAAGAAGYATQITLFPEGSDPKDLGTKPVAHARFAKADPQPDPLWAQVPHRRSTKEPYDTDRPVPAAALERVLAAARQTQAGGTLDMGQVETLRTLTADALVIEIETPHTFKESVDLFRIGKREVNANPDGIDFQGVFFEGLSTVGMFGRAQTLDTSSMAYKSGIDAVLANAMSAMGFIWQITPGNSREEQIAAGQDWLRLNLALTAEGLAVQPMSQALQEYSEVAALYAQVHQMLAPEGGTVQMLGRIGYGPTVAVSPRWPIEEKLVSA